MKSNVPKVKIVGVQTRFEKYQLLSEFVFKYEGHTFTFRLPIGQKQDTQKVRLLFATMMTFVEGQIEELVKNPPITKLKVVWDGVTKPSDA